MKPGRKILVAAVAALLLVSLFYFPLRRKFSLHEGALINSGQSKRNAVIFFVNQDGKIVGRDTEIVSGATVLDDIKSLITQESLARAGGLLNAIPVGTAVRNVFIDENKCVYIDFERSIIDRHVGGTEGESLTLEALKRTMAENFPELDSMKLLVEGKELASLAGHITTRLKLKVK